MNLLCEYSEPDANDVDSFGMDAMTRKRLKVKDKLEKPGKKRIRRPMRSKLPLSLAKVESRLRRRLYSIGEARRFVTLGKGEKGQHDSVGYVMKRFYYSVPDFENSVVNIEKKAGGWIVNGSWPSSGKQVFDWEFDVWGERGGSVVVKLNMWSQSGRADGETFRTTVATVDKLIPKFVRKYYLPIKEVMKKEAGVKIGRFV